MPTDVTSSDVPTQRIEPPAARTVRLDVERRGIVIPRLNLTLPAGDLASAVTRQPAPRGRSWIARHSVAFGALIGFGTGFTVGYLGSRGDDVDPGEEKLVGLFFGAIGAGIGAVVGAAAR